MQNEQQNNTNDPYTFLLAYGSNVDPTSFKKHCPDAVAIERITIRDYRLAYRSGYLTILPHKGESVECLLWRVKSKHIPALDEYECVKENFYRKETFSIKTSLGTKKALVYIMSDYYALNSRNRFKPPSCSYRGVVQRGYAANGIPITSERRALHENRMEAKGSSWETIKCLQAEYDARMQGDQDVQIPAFIQKKNPGLVPNRPNPGGR